MNLIPKEQWLVVQSRFPNSNKRTYVDTMEDAIALMQEVRRKNPQADMHAMEVLHMAEEE